jgi:hypothetical protein
VSACSCQHAAVIDMSATCCCQHAAGIDCVRHRVLCQDGESEYTAPTWRSCQEPLRTATQRQCVSALALAMHWWPDVDRPLEVHSTAEAAVHSVRVLRCRSGRTIAACKLCICHSVPCRV